jgi:type II secretion system protein N
MPNKKISTSLLFIILFIFFLILQFPYRSLKGYLFGLIYKNTQIRIESEDMAATFFGWPGIKLYNATATIPIDRTQEMEVSAEKITFRIGVGGLFPPTPLIKLSAAGLTKGGDIDAWFINSSKKMTLELNATELALDQFYFGGLPEPFSGKVNVSLYLNYPFDDLSKMTGHILLTGNKIIIPGNNIQGIVIPKFEFPNLKVNLEAKNGILQINSFEFGSPTSELSGKAVGELKLGPTWWQSYLNLTITMHLSEKYIQDPQSVTLVSFLNTFKTSDKGDYALKWGASFQEMSMNIFKALPQKP